MLLINCPFCGERDQSEFTNGGEAHIVRPGNSEEMSDAEWADYVFMRSNTKGVFAERWMHTSGCRKWFNAVRNTATDEILAIYKSGEVQPVIDGQDLGTPSGEPLIGSGNDATKVVRSGEGSKL